MNAKQTARLLILKRLLNMGATTSKPLKSIFDPHAVSVCLHLQCLASESCLLDPSPKVKRAMDDGDAKEGKQLAREESGEEQNLLKSFFPAFP